MTYEELESQLELLLDRAFDDGITKENVIALLEQTIQEVKEGYYDIE